MYLMTGGLIMHYEWGEKKRKLRMKSSVNLSNSGSIAEETESQNASNTQALFGGLGQARLTGEVSF